MPRLIVVDDDLAIHDLLKVFFEDLGHSIECFETVGSAKAHLETHGTKIDLILCDLRLPDGTGLALMSALKQSHLDIPLILITAYGSGEIGANALKQGIFDYVTKPLNLTELEVICNRALKLRKLERLLLDVRANGNEGRLLGMIGQSERMRDLYKLVDKVANTNSCVLIAGERGAGKKLVAQTAHELSRRAQKNFVPVNCSALPGDLLERELFGYTKAALPGATEDRAGLIEEADGGTLLLSDIGEMPLALQTKFLRVLQERSFRRLGEDVDRKVDLRVIATTHRDLKAATIRGDFREALLIHLGVILINPPPLRERRNDIPLLAAHFLRKYSAYNEKMVSGFTRDAMNDLISAPWPGNVRELESVVERAVALCSARWIDRSDLSMEGLSLMPARGRGKMETYFSRILTLKELEKEYIEHVLTTTQGKKEVVAAILGIDRKTLYRKEREYDLIPLREDPISPDVIS